MATEVTFVRVRLPNQEKHLDLFDGLVIQVPAIHDEPGAEGHDIMTCGESHVGRVVATCRAEDAAKIAYGMQLERKRWHEA